MIGSQAGNGSARTFAALLLDKPSRARLTGLGGRLAGLPLRPVPPENLHITLRFYGNSDPGQIAGQCRRVAEAGRLVAGFSVSVRAACWMPRRTPKMLWLALAPSAPLSRLHQLQFAPEESRPRRFLPHVTLLRGRKCALPEAFSGAIEKLEDLAVESVALMKSHLHRSGARYEIVERSLLPAPPEREKGKGRL